MQTPESHPNFPELEEKILKFWQENQILEKYLKKNQESEKQFAFLDGPITANNPMGVHHAHGRTIKDFFQRYKNMQGFKQRFQNGFDCQGLWVEVEEEKDLGFNSKQDIEDFGLDKFSLSCRKRVEKFSKVQTQQSQRLGMFMDWDHSYYSMSERNNLHIWHFLKKVDEKGWLYKGIDAMPWCTRCGTTISQHELSDGGYKDVTHESIYVKLHSTFNVECAISDTFKLKSRCPTSFLIWTTTPWTLLANVAVAIHPEHQYVIAETNEDCVILTQNRLSVLPQKYEVKAEFKGQQLLDLLKGLEADIYKGPFDELEKPGQVAHRLIPWEEVSDKEGTGLVHIAPGAGKEDFELRKQHSLDILSPIDEFGNYIDGYGNFTGKNVSKVTDEIYDSLKSKNLFFKTEPIHHSYPHCWRCKEELVFRTTTEWFIKTDEIRPSMKQAAAQVNWMPEHAEKRMQDWLDNMGDWPISRKRFWGLALPFYESEDGQEYYVVENKEELRKLAIEPEKVDKLSELHRPWIDEIKIKSPKTGNTLTRIKDVGDCWLDAGIVPFSTVDYLTNKKYWQQWYPFEFITEYVAQVKLWFYSTLFMSVTLENQTPWKNVLATGFLVDEKGEAMHKSKGNAIDFDEAAGKAGVDSIRWLYLKERVANYYGTGNLRFGYHILDEVRRRFLVILWNTYRFFVQNAILDKWIPNQEKLHLDSSNLLDEWVLSRINHVIKTTTQKLNNYNSPDAAKTIETFIVNDFSQWYIRRSRSRVGPTVIDSKDKQSFYETCYFVLTTLTKLLAPFVPFLAEEMYQNLRCDKDPISLHVCNWPKADESSIRPDSEENMSLIRAIAEKIHAERKAQSMRVRQPLSNVTVTLRKESKLEEQLIQILLAEVNIHELGFRTDPNLVPEISVELDNQITEELQKEGQVRELIRAIQKIRREADYQLDQKIKISVIDASESIKTLFETFKPQLKQRLLADSISFVQLSTSDITKEIKINGETATITLQKI